MRKLLPILFSFFSFVALGQVAFQNPSFEGTPQPHIVPLPWASCWGTPDTQPGTWGITQAPADGYSYISFLMAGDGVSYSEGASQLLSPCLLAGQTYSFSLSVAFSHTYDTAEPVDCYGSLGIWGSSIGCGQTELLWHSGMITDTAWQNVSISFTPTQNWCNISFGNYFITPCSGYINIMIDKAGPILPSNSIDITGPADASDLTICDSTIVITGTVSSPADSVIISSANSPDGIATFADTANWSYQYNLPSGNYPVTVYATAYMANGNTLVDTIVVDRHPHIDFDTTNLCNNFTYTFFEETETPNSFIAYQWFVDDNLIGWGSSLTYSFTDSGSYNVCMIAYDDGGCYDTICKPVSITLCNAIGELKAGIPSIFPNPVSSGAITIVLPPGAAATQLQIIDMLGRVIVTQNNLLEGKNNINLPTMAKGCYLVRLTSKNGMHTDKVIID